MDHLDHDRRVIEAVLDEYTRIPYAYGDLRSEAVYDRERDRYALVTHGWDGIDRVHFTLVHVDLIGGKLWIQHDATEHGIGRELVAAGVPAERIVLGYRSPAAREHSGYAVV